MPEIHEPGTNMTPQDMRAQATACVDEATAIEAKFMTQAMPPDDEARVKQLLTWADGYHLALQQLDERKARVTRLGEIGEWLKAPQAPEQARALAPAPGEGGTKRGMRQTPGDQFAKSATYLSLKNRGAFNSMLRTEFGVEMEEGTSLLQWKTVLFGGSAASGGAFVQNDVQTGYLELLQREINVLSLIPRLTTDSDTVEYVKQTSFTNNAAFVAEATGNARTGTDGLKPESAMAFEVVTAPVKSLAHWLPVTNRMLADASQIRGVINSQLLLGLSLVLESQVISGDGTGDNLTGILNSGLNTIAKGADNEVDALFKARTMARTASKLSPTGIVLNPIDYQQVRLLRENAASATLGQYLMGPPNTMGVPTVWGLPVVESEALVENTALVGNFAQGATIFDREMSSIRVGTINEQFIRNIQTILAEQRVTFVVWRPTAFTRVTGY
jgi:HK97 family phage major capsid protein